MQSPRRERNRALRARSQEDRGSCAPLDAAQGPLSPRAPRYRRCVPRRVRARFCSGSRGHRVFTDPPGPQPPSQGQANVPQNNPGGKYLYCPVNTAVGEGRCSETACFAGEKKSYESFPLKRSCFALTSCLKGSSLANPLPPPLGRRSCVIRGDLVAFRENGHVSGCFSARCQKPACCKAFREKRKSHTAERFSRLTRCCGLA